MTHEARRFDIDGLPDLATRVGLPGAMARAEVGGAGCGETGILIGVISTLVGGE